MNNKYLIYSVEIPEDAPEEFNNLDDAVTFAEENDYKAIKVINALEQRYNDIINVIYI